MPARPPAVARVLERVTAAARSHEMFDPGSTVVVAVSGGADSLCLLHALHRLRRLLRIRVAVFHFDHGLHRASGDHAAYVRRQARRLRLPFEARRADARPAAGESIEAWARVARYAALSEAAVELGADRAALGHTQDDQAETVLLGLARGGGLEAVAGMAPVSSIPPLGLRAVRPLLEVTRAETEGFCRALRLRPREDPSNRDRRFLRNRMRLDVLPALERRLDRNLRTTLARTAELVRSDVDLLEAMASEAARDVVALGEREVRIDPEALGRLPGPVAGRVVRDAIRIASAMGGPWGGDVEAAHVRAVIDLAGGRPGRRADLPGRLMARRERRYVRLTRS